MKPKHARYGKLVFRGQTILEGEWAFLNYKKKQLLQDPTVKPYEIIIAHLDPKP